MANNITPKLKAYVQTDATGRVVSGTPVFRSSKPKDGNWREIPMYYRGTNSSTTTTTTNGGTTPTAWVAYRGSNYWYACNSPSSTSIVYTSINVAPLPAGTPLYTDALLTTLISGSDPLSINGRVYDIINGHTNPLGGDGLVCGNITTSTTSSTSNPFSYYYTANSYNCPDCSTVVGTNTIIVSNTPLSVGDFVPSYYSPQTLFQVVGSAAPYYMANQVQGYSASNNCISTCPYTTYRVGNIQYGSSGEACSNQGDINGGSTLFGTGSEYVVGTQLYYDAQHNFAYTMTGWVPVMTSWPSGQARSMYISNGIIQSSSPC